MDKGIETLIADMKGHAEHILELEAEKYQERELIDAYDRADTVFSAGNVKSLIAALEQARTEREEFRKRLKLERQIVEDADKRIAELESAPNGMMQLSNELAEMKRKCAELESGQFNEVELRELLTWRYTERSASMDPLLWAAMRNKIILSIEVLDESGKAKWSNRDA